MCDAQSQRENNAVGARLLYSVRVFLREREQSRKVLSDGILERLHLCTLARCSAAFCVCVYTCVVAREHLSTRAPPYLSLSYRPYLKLSYRNNNVFLHPYLLTCSYIDFQFFPYILTLTNRAQYKFFYTWTVTKIADRL